MFQNPTTFLHDYSMNVVHFICKKHFRKVVTSQSALRDSLNESTKNGGREAKKGRRTGFSMFETPEVQLLGLSLLPNPTETLAMQARKIVIVIVIEIKMEVENDIVILIVILVANVIVIEKMMETEIDVDRG